MVKNEEFKKIILDYVERYEENNIKLIINIDKNKRSAKINKELFDS
jgi:hypothetical protein